MSDTVTTIRPVANVSTSTWATGGGSGILYQNLADDDPTSFVQAFPYVTSAPSSTLAVRLHAFTLDDTDLLKYLQVWVNISMLFPMVSGDIVNAIVKLYAPDDSKKLPDQIIRVVYPGLGLYTLLPFAAWPDGSPFTADDLADGLILRLQVQEIDAATIEGVNWYEAGVDIVYNRAPTVAISHFAAAFDNVAQTFTYSDPEADTQERYEDRVYELPTAGFPAGATDDDVIDALDALGVEPVFTENRLTDLTTLNTFLGTAGYTYRRFIRAADQGSGQRFGHWDSDLFALDAWDHSEHPKIPTLTVASDAANARLILSLSVSGTGVTPDYYEIERSDDLGATYQTVLGAAQLAYAAGTLVFYDRFAPRLFESIYRVRTVAAPSSPLFVFTSPWISASAVLHSDGHSWLQAADDDSLDLAFIQAGTSMQRQVPEQQSSFYAEGRAEPIVFGGTIHLGTSTLAATFTDEAAFERFEQLRALRGKLLLRTLYGEGPLLDYWIRFGAVANQTLVGGYSIEVKGQLRRVAMPYYEVAAPSATA